MHQVIVVGAHKSDTARRAVAEAIELSRALHAHLHLVTAYPKGRSETDGVDTPSRLDAQRTLDELAPAVGSVTTHAIPGDPAKAILTIADQVDADLIVVGNKGMKGKGRVLGSVPNDVAHNARCDVLIVPTS